MWPGNEAPFAFLVTGLAGWVWGSFLNQVVDRTPRAGGPAATAGPSAPPALSLLHPRRSVCLACGAPIPWHDNVPVVSYLRLRGRCRACGALIGRRTLLLETATPLAFLGWLGLVRALGLQWAALLWGFALLSWALVALPIAWERRRLRPLFLALGALALAGLLLSLAGGPGFPGACE